MWALQVLAFGLLALIFFVFYLTYAQQKKYAHSLVFGILELISAVISSAAWAWALRVSGKVDWLLLGLIRYTFLALIFIAMLTVGVYCIVTSIRKLSKQGKPVAPDNA